MTLSVSLMVAVLEKFRNVISDTTALTNQMSHPVIGEFIHLVLKRAKTNKKTLA